MKLIDQDFLANEVQRLEKEIISMALKQSINLDLLLNQIFGHSLKVYLLLTYMMSFIKIEENINKEDIFYNRYFWFSRFTKLKEKIEGYDPGINQQMVRLLEEVDYNDLEIDWNFIQKISDDLDMEI